MAAAASPAVSRAPPTRRCASARPTRRSRARSTRSTATWCGRPTGRGWLRSAENNSGSDPELLLQGFGPEQLRIQIALAVGLEVHAVGGFDLSLLVERLLRKAREALLVLRPQRDSHQRAAMGE